MHASCTQQRSNYFNLLPGEKLSIDGNVSPIKSCEDDIQNQLFKNKIHRENLRNKNELTSSVFGVGFLVGSHILCRDIYLFGSFPNV
jgi:hypothetical protein